MADTGNGTAINKHSLLITGHQTSVSLEDVFWQRLRDVAVDRGLSVAGLVAEIDAGRNEANLSSAIRVFLLEEALGAVSMPAGAPAALPA